MSGGGKSRRQARSRGSDTRRCVCVAGWGVGGLWRPGRDALAKEKVTTLSQTFAGLMVLEGQGNQEQRCPSRCAPSVTSCSEEGPRAHQAGRSPRCAHPAAETLLLRAQSAGSQRQTHRATRDWQQAPWKGHSTCIEKGKGTLDLTASLSPMRWRGTCPWTRRRESL